MNLEMVANWMLLADDIKKDMLPDLYGIYGSQRSME